MSQANENHTPSIFGSPAGFMVFFAASMWLAASIYGVMQGFYGLFAITLVSAAAMVILLPVLVNKPE